MRRAAALELHRAVWRSFYCFFVTLVTGPRRSLSLKLSDTRVYEPQILDLCGARAGGGGRASNGYLHVRIHFITKMIWWTGLAPWEFEFPFPGSLISTFPWRLDLCGARAGGGGRASSGYRHPIDLQNLAFCV